MPPVSLFRSSAHSTSSATSWSAPRKPDFYTSTNPWPSCLSTPSSSTWSTVLPTSALYTRTWIGSKRPGSGFCGCLASFSWLFPWYTYWCLVSTGSERSSTKNAARKGQQILFKTCINVSFTNSIFKQFIGYKSCGINQGEKIFCLTWLPSQLTKMIQLTAELVENGGVVQWSPKKLQYIYHKINCKVVNRLLFAKSLFCETTRNKICRKLIFLRNIL